MCRPDYTQPGGDAELRHSTPVAASQTRTSVTQSVDQSGSIVRLAATPEPFDGSMCQSTYCRDTPVTREAVRDGYAFLC